jgi:hypothetical protein
LRRRNRNWVWHGRPCPAVRGARRGPGAPGPLPGLTRMTGPAQIRSHTPSSLRSKRLLTRPDRGPIMLTAGALLWSGQEERCQPPGAALSFAGFGVRLRARARRFRREGGAAEHQRDEEGCEGSHGCSGFVAGIGIHLRALNGVRPGFVFDYAVAGGAGFEGIIPCKTAKGSVWYGNCPASGRTVYGSVV